MVLLKWILVLFLVFCFPFMGLTQNHKLVGKVVDAKKSPIFAANVYLSDLRHVTITGLDGRFKLSIDQIFPEDTLVVSFVGYQKSTIKLSELDFNESHEFLLLEDLTSLESVTVIGRNPISESYSISKLERLEIYGIPIAAGDPLKAVTALASSTDTDETANPSLRGSSADRSIVTLNGVPVLNPVRNSQISGIGNFSLFNTEIISEQYIYASNPPLTYGNSTGGLVEIKTSHDVSANQTQFSAGLANLGLFLTRKITDNSFIQAYSNYQFHDIFTKANKESMGKLNSFGNYDFGYNLKIRINDKLTLNSFTYGINEFYNMESEQFSFVDNSIADNKRVFTINNLILTTTKGILSLNSGYDISNSNYKYGIIKSSKRNNISYNSIDYKWFLHSNIVLQFGTSYTHSRYSFRDTIPKFYFSLSPVSPSFSADTCLYNNNLESYFFSKWQLSNKMVLSSGFRSNLPINDQKHYISFQTGLRYDVSIKSSFLFSFGKYHNYSTPNYSLYKYRLLNSNHLALDYSFKKNGMLVNAAIYYKTDRGESTPQDALEGLVLFDKLEHFGLEFSVERDFYKYFKLYLANTFLEQTLFYDGEEYTGSKSLKYFIKSSLSYNNPKLFNLSLSYITRPGLYYTNIIGSEFNPEYDMNLPVYGIYNNDQYNNYNNISISINRFFRINKSAVIAFASISNILNTHNERMAIYNNDFSFSNFDFYQKRTIYFGAIFRF
jgi:hypothetical protein